MAELTENIPNLEKPVLLLLEKLENEIKITSLPKITEEQELKIRDNIARLLKRNYKELKILARTKYLIPRNLQKIIISLAFDNGVGDDTLGGDDTMGDDDIVIDDIFPDEPDPVIDLTNASGTDKGNIKFVMIFSKTPFNLLAETSTVDNVLLKSKGGIALEIESNKIFLFIETNEAFSDIGLLSKEIINLAIEK